MEDQEVSMEDAQVFIKALLGPYHSNGWCQE